MKLDLDILHVNFPNPYNAYVGALVGIRKKIPCVLTWHNDLPHVTSIAGVLAYAHDLLVSHSYLRYYSRIIATSEVYLRSSNILQKYKEKVTVIQNGVDSQRFNTNVCGEEIRSLHKMKDSKIILFVGALTKWHRYKGLNVLIKAFNRIVKERNDVNLIIVGEGMLKQEYHSLCLQLNLTEKVVFTGDIQDDELPKYYAASDMVVLPSIDRSEGFGLILLEANACGKPIIGSNVGGISSVIRQGVNGILVPPCNEKSLAAAILHIIENEDVCHKMGLNGRKIAEKNDWEKVAKAVNQVYMEVLEQHLHKSLLNN